MGKVPSFLFRPPNAWTGPIQNMENNLFSSKSIAVNINLWTKKCPEQCLTKYPCLVKLTYEIIPHRGQPWDLTSLEVTGVSSCFPSGHPSPPTCHPQLLSYFSLSPFILSRPCASSSRVYFSGRNSHSVVHIYFVIFNVQQHQQNVFSLDCLFGTQGMKDSEEDRGE